MALYTLAASLFGLLALLTRARRGRRLSWGPLVLMGLLSVLMMASPSTDALILALATFDPARALPAPLQELVRVEREVHVLPIWRERLALRRAHGDPLRLLVTGCPEEHLDAVVRLLCRQHDYVADHDLDRGPELAPPEALEPLRAR